MTEDKKHQLDKLDVTDILSYLGARASSMEEQIRREHRQLAKAMGIIENIIRVTWGEGWNYSLDWKVKAEQFLKEVEK